MSLPIQCKSRRKQHFPAFFQTVKLVAWATIFVAGAFPGLAQNWDAVFPLEGGGRENIQIFEILAPDRIFIAGTYEMSFSPGGENLPSFGDRDLFFGEWDYQGNNIWIEGAGGTDDDSFTAFYPTEDGSFLLTGLFFDDLQIGGATLSSDNSSGTLFLVKLDATGDLIWSTLISGNNAPRAIYDVTEDNLGQVYVCGGFGSELAFEDGTLLQSQGPEDVFIARFGANGVLQQVVEYGQSGSSFAQRFAWLDTEQLIIAGNFNESLLLGPHQLIAESLDPDLFLAALDPSTLAANWAVRLGAQYEDQLTEIIVQDGQIIVGGYFLGVLRFEPDIVTEITTPGFNFNIFLATLSADGTPLTLEGFGGAGDQFLSDLAVDDGRILFAGYYIEELNLDELSFPPSPGNIQGFTASRSNTNWAWGTALTGDDNTLIEHVETDGQGNVWVAGNYQTTADFDGATEIADGFSEGFFARLDRNLTPVLDVPPSPFRIYPNPAGNLLWLDGLCDESTIKVIDSSGRSYPLKLDGYVLDTSTLPSGSYVIEIQSCEKRSVLPFIKH